MLAAGLLVAWLVFEPRTPDLAAQVYRLGLYERVGMAVWDARWYGGHMLPGYSLLFGPLGSLAGLHALAVTAAIVSVALFERIVLGVYGRSRWVLAGACLFAVAAVGDVWSGRVTFALGVTFALACVWAARRAVRWAVGGTARWGWLAVAVVAVGLLAAACTAASPVAGLLLALAAVTYALVYRAVWVAAVIVGAVALVAVPVRVLFPEGGFEPYPLTSFMATIVALGLFWWALPRGRRARRDPRVRVLRTGALLYAIACGLCVVVHTPMGSNVERYGVLLAGPLLLCALAVERVAVERETASAAASTFASTLASTSTPTPTPTPTPTSASWRVGVAVCAIAAWVVWGPVRETAAVAGSPATTAAYYAPVKRWLLRHGGTSVRVEVPLTRSHWEAAELAPYVSLARGWEKQLEERYDHVLLLGHGLTAGVYYAWLREQAVAYVALPDVPLDSSSAREGELIRRGLPYLRLVFASAHWRVYAVAGATPIVSGPGTLRALGVDTFTLDARAAGTMLVRVHYTPYFTVTAGQGCVARAPGGWTYVRAHRPGRMEVAARFSLEGAQCTGARP